ncbi:MAG: zinc ribbon domain-containing protein [Chloroflexi bacterium]|nr:zinc ribbon domain-containing protein [Chloroflexota bacterium]
MGQGFRCPRCGTRSEAGQRFCTGCSQPFYYTCVQCNSFVDSSFKFCPNCSTSLNWDVKPRANLQLLSEMAPQSSPKHKYRTVMPILMAVLLLAMATAGYLLYRFPASGLQVPAGYESYQELAEATEPYVMAPPNSQYSGIPLYVKGPGEYIRLNNNAEAGNVSFEVLKAFIVSDQTDKELYIPGMRMCGYFAETLHNNAERIGIRTAAVIVEFEDGSAPHALNAFETTDRGLVYIDCTGTRRSPADFEEWLYKLFYPIGQDRMAYVAKGKEYGTILLEDAESTDYSYYAGYSKSWGKDERSFFVRPAIVKSVKIYW